MISGRWFKARRIRCILKDAVSVFGLFSILIAVVDFFPALAQIGLILQNGSFLIGIGVLAMIYGLIKNRPENKFVFKINNRDVEIALKIGDIEKMKSAYVVPVNSEFDMALGGSVKASKSVESMVIRKYFAGDHRSVQARVSALLKSKAYAGQKVAGKYKLGTTVRVDTDDKKKVFYFVANSEKLNDNRVEASEDGLYMTLSGLWAYASTHGAKEEISIPLLGTGQGRLKMPREDVYKEIVRSFIASCSGKSYCERLTIVIRDEDVSKCKIDVDELVEFMKLNSQYVDFAKGAGPYVGASVG